MNASYFQCDIELETKIMFPLENQKKIILTSQRNKNDNMKREKKIRSD
jgi:hypothetical protein